MNSGQRFTGETYHEIDDDIWSSKLVSEVLIDALKMNNGLVRGDNMGGGGGWPEELTEFSDILSQISGGQTFETEMPRTILTNDQVTRVDDVIEWQMRYLKEHTGPARMLSLWLATKLSRLSFRDQCESRRIPRASAYRAKDRALTVIALALTADLVEPFSMGRLR